MAAITTTTTSDRAWSPDIQAFAPDDILADALVLQTSTQLGTVEGDVPAVRVAFVDDDEADFVAEGHEIPEADPALNEVVIFTGKISQLVRISREQWSQPSTSPKLADAVARAVRRKADEAYLAQPVPTAPAVTPPAGLVNIAGVQMGTPVADSLDALVDLVAVLQVSGATPTHLVTDPTGWAALRKLKTTTDSNVSLLGAGTADAEAFLLGLPVLVSPAMPAGTGLVIDRSAVVSAVGQVMVAQSEHQYFSSDSIALRCTWRLGWNLVRPERCGKFTIGDQT
ncbi:MAG: phage major capsid protein [Micrococcales bacterium]|nr:phage major capsid protein [Micrococcales bacterium]